MNKKYCIILLIMSSLVVISLVGSVSAANLTVNSSGNIQAALNNASSSDVIQIGNGTYTGTGNVNLTVNKNVSITGSGSTIIDVRGRGNVFNIPTGVIVTISNINFINGNLSSVGGGIHNLGILYVTNCNFANNTAGWGGAISNEGKLTVTNCTFTGNIATHDGGALNSNNFLNVTDSTFTSNRALHVAGGIMNWYGTLKVTSSTFTGNTAPSEGSAISNYGPAELHFNRITGNGRYGLYNAANAITNATNNWWGSNTPIVSGSTRDIYRVSGTVIYDPWLFLTVTANPTSTNGNSVITLDLTHNSNNDDTSTQGHFPNMPVNLGTNLGTVVNLVYIKNGKVNTTFNRGTATSGTATITTILDNQTRQTNITIDTISPTVTASPVGGNYNTTQTVTLSATDNLDPNPTIYYTVDGSTPTISSTRYISSINISSITTLKYIAVDVAGNQGPVKTEQYIFGRVFNINTGTSYSSIQAAIDDPLTIDGDVIVVLNGTFYENILVYKKLTLTSLAGDNVTIYNKRLNIPVFTITNDGSGSTIHGFNLIFLFDEKADHAELDPYNVFLQNANNCAIYGNTISCNSSGGGIYLTHSCDNIICGNNVKNCSEGIIIVNSSNNNLIAENNVSENGGGILIQVSEGNFITQNNINANKNGLSIYCANDNDIYGNTISNNVNYGFHIFLSSVNINFNIIVGNNFYGLYNEGNRVINATNNWWGTNNPKNLATYGSAVYANEGTVLYNPWLQLNLTGSVIHVTHNSTSSSEITADITHNNQGQDTSSSGTIPDGLPVNFTTTLGTITPTATTKSGKATVILTSRPSSGATTVTASTYNQTVSKAFRKSFSTIQAAISNTLTVNGDVIVVANGTYTENIFVNKNLTLISEGNVIVQASNPSNPVIYIYSWGSGTVIAYFKLINASYSCGIYLSSATNCTIYSNSITGNFNGIVLHLNANGNTILNNTILNNKNVGIGLDYSNNNTITKNNVSYNWVGTSSLDSYNNIISRNKLYRNGLYGVYMDDSNDEILENSITYNICGIGLHRSATNQIHFNQIYGNTYGLFANGTSVMINATNNWWGHENNTPRVAFTDTPADIIIYNGNVNYDPWLILTVYPTSYKVANGKIYEATISADLRYNSDGTDTSLQGCVPDGIPVYFYSQYGTNTFQQLQSTLNGKASATLVRDPNYHDVIFVMGAVDGDYTFTGVDWIAKAVVNVVGSAVNASNTNQKLNLTCEIPLNDPTTWVSVLWKETSLYHGEVDLIVNGVIVKSCNVVNAAYLTYQNSYSENVFILMRYFNKLFLNPVGSTTFEPNIYLQAYILEHGLENSTFTVDQMENYVLSEFQTEYGCNNNQTNFIKTHHNEFIDLIGNILVYPGDAAKTISFVDPDNNQTVILNCPGNPILRMSPMIYFDGQYKNSTTGTYYDVGYEGLRSYALATTNVTNSIIQYWLNKQSQYAPGAMKAAYGTFLTSLLIIKCHDMVADQAATAYNVTWSRTTPVVVSHCDDAASTYITGESDLRMGMDVNGTAGNVWAFRFACSSAFSPIEEEVGGTNNTGIGSVTLGIGERILQGETPELFYSNRYIVLKIKDKDDLILLVDPVTGIVTDIMDNACVVYCYHNQMTEQRIDQAEDIISGDPSKTQWLNSTEQISMASSSAVLVGLEVTGSSPLFLAGIEIGSTVPVVGVMIGGGLVLAAVLNYICDQYGWLPPEQSREILGNAFLPFALINTFLYDESTPTTKQLEEAYWKAGHLLMAIDESDYEELYDLAKIGTNEFRKRAGQQALKESKNIIGVPDPKDGDKAAYLINLYKDAIKNMKGGAAKVLGGNIKSGTAQFVWGVVELHMASTYMYSAILPKELQEILPK